MRRQIRPKDPREYSVGLRQRDRRRGRIPWYTDPMCERSTEPRPSSFGRWCSQWTGRSQHSVRRVRAPSGAALCVVGPPSYLDHIAPLLAPGRMNAVVGIVRTRMTDAQFDHPVQSQRVSAIAHVGIVGDVHKLWVHNRMHVFARDDSIGDLECGAIATSACQRSPHSYIWILACPSLRHQNKFGYTKVPAPRGVCRVSCVVTHASARSRRTLHILPGRGAQRAASDFHLSHLNSSSCDAGSSSTGRM